jgi:hypothetical protein
MTKWVFAGDLTRSQKRKCFARVEQRIGEKLYVYYLVRVTKPKETDGRIHSEPRELETNNF